MKTIILFGGSGYIGTNLLKNLIKNSIFQKIYVCDLNELIGRVARHYLERAIDVAHGNKSKAAELVGLPSYQTLSNWMKKYGVH